MGIGDVGAPDVAALMKLLSPINSQAVQDVVEEAVKRENEMARKLLKVNLIMQLEEQRLDTVGKVMDLYI